MTLSHGHGLRVSFSSCIPTHNLKSPLRPPPQTLKRTDSEAPRLQHAVATRAPPTSPGPSGLPPYYSQPASSSAAGSFSISCQWPILPAVQFPLVKPLRPEPILFLSRLPSRQVRVLAPPLPGIPHMLALLLLLLQPQFRGLSTRESSLPSSLLPTESVRPSLLDTGSGSLPIPGFRLRCSLTSTRYAPT